MTSSASPRHKMLGPTGIGVLWARRELLEAMPAVPGRRRDDPRRPPRRLHRQRRCPGSSRRGPHPSPRRSGWAPPSTTCAELAMEAVRAHEIALTAYALARWRTASARTSRSSGRRTRRPRRRRLASRTRTSTPTTSPRCSTRRGCASGPATTAPSPSCAASASTRPPGRRCTCTTTKPTSTCWSTPLAGPLDELTVVR